MTREELLKSYPDIRGQLSYQLDLIEYYKDWHEFDNDSMTVLCDIYRNCLCYGEEFAHKVATDVYAYAKEYFAKKEQEEKHMDNIQIFKNPEFGEVRVIERDDEPWFVGKDVALILGYSDTNKAVAMHVDSEDKKLNDKTSSSFGQRGATLINESGLYSLIISSKLPTAKAFKHWVTSEVLPSIRKTGAYAVKQLSPEEEMARGLLAAQKMLAEKDERIKELEPKGVFADAVSASKSSILIGELAKILRGNGVKIGQNKLFDWLRAHGYLMKHGSSKNMPTQKSMELGLFEIKEGSYVNGDGVNIITKTPKVTGKGQQYFVNKFLH